MRHVQEKDMLAEIAKLTDAVQELTEMNRTLASAMATVLRASAEISGLLVHLKDDNGDLLEAIKLYSGQEVLVPISFSGNYKLKE